MIPVPEFELSDQDGEPFSRTDLTGQWSLLVFDPSSHTNSPAYHRLIQVHNHLAAEPFLQRNCRFIYIPRQREAEIDVSVTRLGANILALHGEPSSISDISKRFGIEEAQEGFILYLIDPDAKIRALFTHAQDAATIATDFTTLFTYQR